MTQIIILPHQEGFRRIVWSLFFLIATHLLQILTNSPNTIMLGIAIENTSCNTQSGLFGRKCAKKGSLQKELVDRNRRKTTKDLWKKD
jgi:hypothetical protein